MVPSGDLLKSNIHCCFTSGFICQPLREISLDCNVLSSNSFLQFASLHSCFPPAHEISFVGSWNSFPTFSLAFKSLCFVFSLFILPELQSFLGMLPTLCDAPSVCQYFFTSSAWSYLLLAVSCKTLSPTSDILSAVPITGSAHQRALSCTELQTGILILSGICRKPFHVYKKCSFKNAA